MSQPLSKSRFLTVQEVADLMRVSTMTVYRLIKAGELPAVRVGRALGLALEPVGGLDLDLLARAQSDSTALEAITQMIMDVANSRSDAQRGGLFTTTIKDPLTGLAFANNQIPTSRIDTRAATLQKYYPAPNVVGNINNFISQGNGTTDNNGFGVKVDHNISANDRLTLSTFWAPT